MTIEKSSFKVSRIGSKLSRGNREIMSSEEDELLQNSASVDSDDGDDVEEEEDESDDADSGVGSDDFDSLELGETNAEFCQLGDSTCSIPLELYGLPGLEDILSVDVWNDCLSEEERFSLAKYLPDMEQDTFVRTLKELFTGSDFHFGSPVEKLFGLLKGGLFEPRVALYREGLIFFQKHQHYHFLCKRQNNMVTDLRQLKDAWRKCRGYSIEERLRVLNIMRGQKSLMYEEMEDVESDSSGREELWRKKVKDKKTLLNMGRYSANMGDSHSELLLRGQPMAFEPAHGKLYPKEFGGRFPFVFPGFGRNSEPYSSAGSYPRYKYYPGAALRTREQMEIYDDYDDGEDPMFGRKTSSIKSDFQASGRNRKVRYPANAQQFAFGDQMKSLKGRAAPLPRKVSRVDLPASDEHLWHSQTYVDGYLMDSPFRADDRNNRVNNGKTRHGSSNGRLHSELRMKPSEKRIRENYVPSGGLAMAASNKRGRIVMENEETESDSSDQFENDDDDGDGRNPLLRSKFACPSSGMESSHRDEVEALEGILQFSKKAKSVRRDSLGAVQALEGILQFSKKADGFGKSVHLPGAESYHPKAKYRDKMQKTTPLDTVLEAGSILGLLKSKDDDNRKPTYKKSKNDNVGGAYPAERRRKGEDAHVLYTPQANYELNYLDDEGDDSPGRQFLGDDLNQRRTGKKGRNVEAYGQHDRFEDPLLKLISVIKKRKVQEYTSSMGGRDEDVNPHQPHELTLSKKKKKRKLEADACISDMEIVELHGKEMGRMDVEMQTKPQKKPFTLITPTVHTGFSFSIMQLLSAVRMAMISQLPNDSVEASKPKEEQNGKQGCGVDNNVDLSMQTNSLTLTVKEIVERVKLKPGDPCILETQEPLQDLVRGVLKILSSKTAPLGAKGWKTLALYESSTKSWSWIGPAPASQSSNDHESIELVASPEAWGLPHRMLVKLVDTFANWLKNGQETLQQLGSLPEPPLALMHVNLDEKERFKDLRAQKSLNTINSSSEEVRAYFRKEELIRYSIPDRAFSYTATDGKKSIVAPLRRCGGKPNSKARDHFMLKQDRPPHVTVLCLVRDAAARLPGSIGTRADVCTLIKDSQYIVEEITDAQLNQVVSGALDRLHYERDPCVQFDSDRKLWAYLHREREEEDFEDDGTSSTKKWKRPRKSPTDQSEQGAVTVASPGTEDQPVVDLGSDLNANPSCIDNEKKMETDHEDSRHNREDNVAMISISGLRPPTIESISSFPI